MKPPKIYIFAFLLLLLNSAYLWPLADPTLFYMSNLVLHMGLGTLLAAVAVRYLSRNFTTLAGWLRWGLLLFLLCAVPGFALMILGGLRPYRWILHLHIALALLAVFVLGLALRAQMKQRSSQTLRLAWKGYALTLPALLLFPLGVGIYRHYVPSEW